MKSGKPSTDINFLGIILIRCLLRKWATFKPFVTDSRIPSWEIKLKLLGEESFDLKRWMYIKA